MSFTVNSVTQITANIPDSVKGLTYAVTLLTSLGFSTPPAIGPHPELFTGGPTVTDISRRNGPATGGMTVTSSISAQVVAS